MIKEIGLPSGKVFKIPDSDGSMHLYGNTFITSIVQDNIKDLIFYTINFDDNSYIILFQNEIEYVRKDDEHV